MHGFETILPFLKPIEHLILDDSVSEVMVNGPDRVFIERNGFVQHVPGITLGERALTVAVKNIARRLGDDISEAKPILDSRLPDGSRVAAVIPPCSLSGVTLTIRKFNSRHFEIEDLIRSGTLDRALPIGWRTTSCSDAIIIRRNRSGKTTLYGARKVHSRRRTHSPHRGHCGDPTASRKSRPIRGAPRTERHSRSLDSRSAQSRALRHRPDRILVGRNPVRRSIRPFAALEYRSFRNSLDDPREFCKTRRSHVSQVASCRAAWSFRIAPSRPISAIH